MTDGMWDSESESDTEDFVFKHHVRLDSSILIPIQQLQYSRVFAYYFRGG